MTVTEPRTLVATLDSYAASAAAAVALHLPADGSVDYLVTPVADYPMRGGKGLRPALLLATAEAFGARLDEAMPSAVAIELLHNAFLIHDDIADASHMRRGAPTLHVRYGMPLALNAGDALAFAAVTALGDNLSRLGPRLAQSVFTEFAFMSRQTVDGQALDIGWRRDNRLDLTSADYLDLIMKKTCWYTTVLPLRVGALIGSRGRAPLDPMIEFGFRLGAAFQIRDDLLNLEGDPRLYGKERFGDLSEGKRTLMLIHLLEESTPDDRSLVESFLATPRRKRTPDLVQRIYELMTAYGSIEFASHFAAGIAHSAVESFEHAFAAVPESPPRRFIRDLIGFMIDRPS